MASPAEYAALKHLLGTYFHSDWDTEGEDWPDLVRNHLDIASAEDVAATADEIDRLLAEGETEERLEERLLNEFGCCYDAHPDADGPGYRPWLGRVAGMLRS